MASDRFYYYDHESCAFVEVQPGQKGAWRKAGAVAALALLLSALGVGVLSQVVTSPAEVAQQAEIEALRAHLDAANDRLDTYSHQLADLAETDREIYRTVLYADPIPAEQFRLGTGGGEADRFGRFATPTAALLRRTSATFDRLEGQMALQTRSYGQLRRLAGRRDAVLRQQPAILPLSGARLTSGFGMRLHPILRVSRMHAGVDFPTAVGTPLVATGDGRVRFIGPKGGYGLVVEIEHPLARRFTRYAHLARPAEGLRVGAPVRRGQVVAYSGDSGLSSAPHLHYEVRQMDAAETPVNPVQTFVPGVTPQQYRELLAGARAPTASFD